MGAGAKYSKGSGSWSLIIEGRCELELNYSKGGGGLELKYCIAREFGAGAKV